MGAAIARQTARREPGVSLVEYYGILPKIKRLAERSVREDAGREGGGHASSHFQIMKPSTLAALRSLQDALTDWSEEVAISRSVPPIPPHLPPPTPTRPPTPSDP